MPNAADAAGGDLARPLRNEAVAVPPTVVPWAHLERVQEHLEQLQSPPYRQYRIRWELAPPEVPPFWHCVDFVNQSLDRFKRFKVGVTHLPRNRYTRFCWEGREPAVLVYLYCTMEVGAHAQLEIQLCNYFKSHSGFLNKRPGGELADLGTPPNFLYVALYYS